MAIMTLPASLSRSSSSPRHHPVPSNSISTSSVRFNRPTTPSHSMTVKKPFSDDTKNQRNGQKAGTTVVASTKKVCLCSPSTHPGAFRCAKHRNAQRGSVSQSKLRSKTTTSYHSSVRLYYRRSAMNNSLMKIGRVEGDLVKGSLAVLIRPSAHNQQRHRFDFQAKPSWLSVMSKAALVQDFSNPKYLRELKRTESSLGEIE